MAVAAKANLLRGGELAWIERRLGAAARMLFGAEMTAVTLNAGNNRLQISRDGGGMAADAGFEVAPAFSQAQGRRSVGRSSGVLSHRDAVLIKLGEIAE